MTGIDIPIPECQLTIHQPTIKEISMLGEQPFFTGAQCLCIDKTAYIEDENLLSKTTNFQILMTILQSPENIERKGFILQVLKILCPSYSITISPRALLFNNGTENVIIDEGNFSQLQDILKLVFCLAASQQDSFNPNSDAAKKIADKLMRARKKIAELKAAEQGNASILAQYLSILTVGLGSMSLNDLVNLTIFQLYDLIERYSLFTNWDLDIKQRLAGGTPDSSPDNWMKNIH